MTKKATKKEAATKEKAKEVPNPAVDVFREIILSPIPTEDKNKKGEQKLLDPLAVLAMKVRASVFAKDAKAKEIEQGKLALDILKCLLK